MHFECLTDKPTNKDLLSFDCPKCKNSKNVYNIFQKMTPATKQRETMLVECRKQSFNAKRRSLASSNLLILMEGSKNIEEKREFDYKKQQKAFEEITYDKRQKGLNAYNVLYNYFNL